jgi:serine/threonine protein kinase/TolB-like protein/CheY-like chemotaxis protein/cytochrome c-type biogenesis protein CcmH/NrfG
MTPARILIAEDESLIAEELRERTERMGLTVTAVVRSGEEAIAHAAETFPDLVLMDIQLKGRVDGTAAASAIRECFDIPVIFLTALSDDVTVERAEKTFPLGYLLKPIAEQELQIAIQVALQYHGMELREQHRGLPQQAEEVGAAAGASRQGFIRSRHPLSPSRKWMETTPFSFVRPPPPERAIQEQLDRILSSQTLSHSKRLVRFLSLVVEKALKQEGGGINECLIGIEVYQRSSSFDPQIDTIVRTEARRLRSKLKQYYESEGLNDPILIEVPKGGYAPTFCERERSVLDKKPGQLISHYRLLEKLGEGSMGTVYLAEDRRLSRRVKLKFIHPARLKEKHAKERLFLEARAAAAIDHPNVAAVYEVGDLDGHSYIVTAHVEGQNLEERILEGPLELRQGLHVARQLADALEAAHTKGVIHRDLNPTKVILGRQERVRIVDFGLAKLSFAGLLTEPGMLVGTANYVSPEQMKGEAVDHRTDIWSLGVILYEVLTAKRPFEADNLEGIYYAIASKSPEPLHRWRAGLPEKLSRIVLKCLEKEPANRYSDVASLKADLSTVLPDVPQVQHSSSATLAVPVESAHESVVTSSSSVALESLASVGGESGQMPGERTTAPQTEYSDTGGKEPLSQDTRLGSSLPFRGQTARWIVAAAFAVLLVLAGSVWWVRSPQRPQPGENLVAAASIPRLVVLPFESRMPGEESQKLSYAISNSLISHLSKLRGLEVTSWTTIARLTERKLTLPEIARILNAQYALEGTLLKSGQQGLMTAQLIRLADDSHIWSEEFDFPWKDLLAVRQKISESVARQMKIQLLPEEEQSLAQNSTQNPQAFQAYAKGRYSLIRFSFLREPSYLNEAETHLNRALEEDPQNANILADLAYLYYQRLYPPQGDRNDLAVQGIAYAERALAIDPNQVEALYILGSLYAESRQEDKGLQLCQKAVQLAPNDPEAHHHLALRYLQRGFYESGIVENRIAIAKDTLFMDPYFYNVIFLNRLGKFETAAVAIKQLEQLEPSSPFPWLLRGDIAFCQGDLPQADAMWRQMSKTEPKHPERSNLTPVLLATISARQGQLEEAHQVLRKLDMTLRRVIDYPIKLAALVGEGDLAIDLIRNSPLHRNYRWLVSDSDIASLSSEPCFQELLYELYPKWQRDLAELGPSLPVRPPKLPTPEEYLSRPTRWARQ